MSGTTRILDRLRQGPATAAELYALHCIVHSRVAELRKQGHVIVCEHTPGGTGPESYVYRLDGPLTDEGYPERDCGSRSVGSVMPSSVSDSLTDRGRGATAATVRSSHDPALLGDGEAESVTGAPQSSEPEPRSRNGGSGAFRGRPSGSEQLCLIEAAA